MTKEIREAFDAGYSMGILFILTKLKLNISGRIKEVSKGVPKEMLDTLEKIEDPADIWGSPK